MTIVGFVWKACGLMTGVFVFMLALVAAGLIPDLTWLQ